MLRRPVAPTLIGVLFVALTLGTLPASALTVDRPGADASAASAVHAPRAGRSARTASPAQHAPHRTGERGPHRSDRVLARDTVAPTARGIRKWPGHKIRYWAKLPADFRWSLKAALRAWNRTGLHMRFVKAPRSRARLRITVGNTQGADGLATVGYQAHNWVHLTPTLVDREYDESDAYARVVAAHIIAHELGHNLGLEHSRGCQLMTAILYLPGCRMMDADQPGYYACRVVDTHALARTVALYGGRRTQAPAACPVDALPPDLTGVQFAGGLDQEAPVRLSWDPPARAPAGARVLALVTSGSACRFPVVQDFYGEAGYDASTLEVKTLDPGKGFWQPPSTGIGHHCYALRLVNRSGAGSRMSTQELQSWVPQPGAPVVTGVRRYYGSGYEGYYQAVATWSAQDGDVAVLARPSGQCVTAWPAAEDVADHLTRAQPGQPFEVRAFDAADQPISSPCLSFFVARSDGLRTSPAATWQVGTEPAPAPPVVTSVERYSGDQYTVTATWADRVAALAVVVRPEGQCVTTWPGGDPTPYLVDFVIDATGVPRPCLSFFTVNAVGGVSATAVTWQVPPAPTPPTPSITDVVDDFGFVTGRTDLDPDVFGLAVVEAPTGACVDTFPADADPRQSAYTAYVYADAGQVFFETFASGESPCLTFFAYNADGDVGPGVQAQL